MGPRGWRSAAGTPALGSRGRWPAAAAAAWRLESPTPAPVFCAAAIESASSAATVSSMVTTSTPAWRTKVWAWRAVRLQAERHVVQRRITGPSEHTARRRTQVFTMQMERAFGQHLWVATVVWGELRRLWRVRSSPSLLRYDTQAHPHATAYQRSHCV